MKKSIFSRVWNKVCYPFELLAWELWGRRRAFARMKQLTIETNRFDVPYHQRLHQEVPDSHRYKVEDVHTKEKSLVEPAQGFYPNYNHKMTSTQKTDNKVYDYDDMEIDDDDTN